MHMLDFFVNRTEMIANTKKNINVTEENSKYQNLTYSMGKNNASPQTKIFRKCF